MTNTTLLKEMISARNVLLLAGLAIVMLILGGCADAVLDDVDADDAGRMEEMMDDKMNKAGGMDGDMMDDDKMMKDGEVKDMMDDDMMKDGEGKMMDDDTAKMEMVTFTVSGKNFAFMMDGKEAPELRVKKGQKVRIEFTAESGFHDWVVDEFDAATERVRDGDSTFVEFVADKIGTFEYYCSVGQHRALGMVGKLIVE